ncbi:hypothetical protein BDR07DRAFT_1015069 [Suillus spraguei]|nr:hypothetical protein BDR07DRAFT_1015069 [Suillus spraguei]
MVLVSNDPSWWPAINASLISSYFIVAGSVGVILYDWGLTLGQEVELIWRQRWSLMTFLYLGVRYGGIIYAVYVWNKPFIMLHSSSISHHQDRYLGVPITSITDTVSVIIYGALDWMSEFGDAMLSVIMIARLYAMYQQSRKMLIFLVVIFLAITTVNVVMIAVMMTRVSVEEYVLSGTYQCMISYPGDSIFLASMSSVLAMVREILVLCLAVWIAVKHFRELRQHSTSTIMKDCFVVLMKTHVTYFACFFVFFYFRIGLISSKFSANPYSMDTEIYIGLSQIFQAVTMFVLGPRLILGVRDITPSL